MGRPLEYLVGITAFTCLMLSVSAQADDKNKAENGIRVQADLSIAQEAQPTVLGLIESASITAEFEKDLSAVDVNFKINGGSNVFAAHFHCAPAGSNGPVAVTLFSGVLGPLMFDGEKVSGTLTNADVHENSCLAVIGQPVNNIASLAMAMRAGLIYTNVHTFENPGGEVRGQMFE
jgi:hypothetical protein